MYEPNVFVVLKPRDGKNRAQSAFKLPHNARWFRRATGGVAEQATIGSRDVTPADSSEYEDEDEGIVDRLVVTFHEVMRLPNLSNGLQAGTNTATSHILLGHRGTKGISGQQYSITVDDDLCIWLHDYTSTHGTAVGYSGQNEKETHKKDTWILAYQPGKRNRFGDITINCGGLVTAVEFPNHTIQTPDPKYIEALKAFAAECKNEVVPAVEGLDLDTQSSTQAPSEAHTISDRLVYYKEKKIGSGSFAQVYRLIRARDGKFVAAKIFTPPAGNNKRARDKAESTWLASIRREYTLIKDNPHPNVIQVFELRETPEVMITMPYYQGGSMAQAGIVAEEKFVTAFGQILDCLAYLHARNIVHRDLKPENILFEPVPYFKVVVSDFGLSKAIEGLGRLQTFCGTLKYAAPEIFPGTGGYGALADIWSVAVMELEWLHGIPVPPPVPLPKQGEDSVPDRLWRTWSVKWMTKLRDYLNEEDSGQVVDILSNMLTWKESRWSASCCLRKGFENGLFKRRNVDGLVMCTNDEEEAVDLPQAALESDGATKDSQPSVTSASSMQRQNQGQGIDTDATIILGDDRLSIW
ncbi:kinase-like domain-containing protein [Diaporthe sp. PMI_573]|nr:kinase-like domain-containing protein [Diaporthaceae sp. PMI_573]